MSDLSDAAVEQLAREHSLIRLTFGMTAVCHDDTAATLRALAAERATLRAERDAAGDLTWFWTIVDRGGFASVPSDEKEALSRMVSDLARLPAERDAARAEAQALRAAVERIADDYCPDNACEAMQALEEMREDLRAALAAAQEATHAAE